MMEGKSTHVKSKKRINGNEFCNYISRIANPVLRDADYKSASATNPHQPGNPSKN
jgi:hypothetical protein